MATVLVVDDRPLPRETLRRTIATVPGVTRAVAASSGEEALVRWPLERPSLVVVDVRVSGTGGVETTRRLLARHPGTTVVVVGSVEDADGVARAVAAGARGYLLDGVSPEELAAAVVQCLDDGSRRRTRPTRPLAPGTAPRPTERESQVLRGMSRGLSNSEIGRELYLSEDTVKTHARRLFRTLAAADRAHAVAVGFRWGLLG